MLIKKLKNIISKKMRFLEYLNDKMKKINFTNKKKNKGVKKINYIYNALEKNKVDSNRAEPNRLSINYSNFSRKKYLNFSQEKEIRENKESTIDTIALKVLKVMQNSLTDYNIYYETDYINLSVNNDDAEDAPEALMVMQQTDTLCPDGPAGSTPAWGGSAFKISDKSINKIKEVII